DLGFGQVAHVAGARHVGAGVVGLGVPDLAPGVLHDRLGRGAVRVGDAAQLAVVVQAGTDGAEGDFFLGDLVAVVAVAAIGRIGLVAPGEAAAALGDLLALLPVAQELAVRRPLDRLQVGFFQALGHRRIELLAGGV